jgi:hypothetical protein
MYEKCSPSLVTREMQVKATLRYHLAILGMVVIKKADEGVEKKETCMLLVECKLI